MPYDTDREHGKARSVTVVVYHLYVEGENCVHFVGGMVPADPDEGFDEGNLISNTL